MAQIQKKYPGTKQARLQRATVLKQIIQEARARLRNLSVYVK